MGTWYTRITILYQTYFKTRTIPALASWANFAAYLAMSLCSSSLALSKLQNTLNINKDNAIGEIQNIIKQKC